MVPADSAGVATHDDRRTSRPDEASGDCADKEASSAVSLPDGRTLGYAEYGLPDGVPVVCLHGIPGSRRLWSLFDDAAKSVGVRVVAPDRPGFGASDFQPGRTLLDWPADLERLLDDLGIDRAGVVGFSGGGPYALACGVAMPERTTAIAVASSVGPPGTRTDVDRSDRLFFGAVRYVPGFSRLLFAYTARVADPGNDRFADLLFGDASDQDRTCLTGPTREVVLEDAAAAFENGGRGPAYEFRLLERPWGFDLADVRVPVAVWHGRDDRTVDVDVARTLADGLPESDLTTVDRGHYSTLLERRAAILRSVAGDGAGI